MILYAPIKKFYLAPKKVVLLLKKKKKSHKSSALRATLSNIVYILLLLVFVFVKRKRKEKSIKSLKLSKLSYADIEA